MYRDCCTDLSSPTVAIIQLHTYRDSCADVSCPIVAMTQRHTPTGTAVLTYPVPLAMSQRHTSTGTAVLTCPVPLWLRVKDPHLQGQLCLHVLSPCGYHSNTYRDRCVDVSCPTVAMTQRHTSTGTVVLTCPVPLWLLLRDTRLYDSCADVSCFTVTITQDTRLSLSAFPQRTALGRYCWISARWQQLETVTWPLLFTALLFT